MKKIAILGSTGSIGKNALNVVKDHPDKFKVIALSTNANIDSLLNQVKEFRPSFVCVNSLVHAAKIHPRLPRKTKLMAGTDGLKALVAQKDIDEVLVAISGSSALEPVLEAIRQGKQIALANKEALVMAGSIVMREARRHSVKVLPIDSEQSAIWQCLEGQDKNKLKQIYLTASGGPFRSLSASRLRSIRVEDALRHPRWKMGKKITVDSATLMNKGLELLEAIVLFGVDSSKIKVLIHPEAIIHSMVEFVDGVVLGQLSVTDMRIPIQYALSYPERLNSSLRRLDFIKLKSLNFETPDMKRFPCLRLAYEAARELGTMPAVMNAANEVCVEAFLMKRAKFTVIPRVIEKVMQRHRKISRPGLGDILEADSWAKIKTEELLSSLN